MDFYYLFTRILSPSRLQMSDALPWGLPEHINSQRREASVTGNLTFPLGSSVPLVSMSSSLVTL